MLDFGPEWIRVLAPATIANLGPGFDVLGVAVRNIEDVGSSKEPTLLGDVVHIRKIGEEGKAPLVISDIYVNGKKDDSLTTNVHQNVAGAAVLDVLSKMSAPSLDLILEKMPFKGSGMGSSAASVVAGAYAALAVTSRDDKYLITEAVVRCEIGQHPDNVLPSLFGGFGAAYRGIDEVERYRTLFDEDIVLLREAVHIVESKSSLDESINELESLGSHRIKSVLQAINEKEQKRKVNNRMQNLMRLVGELEVKAERYKQVKEYNNNLVGDRAGIMDALIYLKQGGEGLKREGFRGFPRVLDELKGRGITEIARDIERAELQENWNVKPDQNRNIELQKRLRSLLNVELKKLLDGYVPQSIELGYQRLNVPESVYDALHFVLVKPDISISTEEARKLINQNPSLKDVVANARNVTRLVTCLYEGNLVGFGKAASEDRIVEPARAPLIPGYYKVKEAALKAGAYGFNISGSGPTCFAITDERDKARYVAGVMMDNFKNAGLESSGFICKVDREGARRV